MINHLIPVLSIAGTSVKRRNTGGNYSDYTVNNTHEKITRF